MNEVWNLWRTFLQKIVERRARKYHKLPGLHQHQYSVFWQMIYKKKSARWFPHCLTAEQKQKRLEIATLLKQWFNIEGQAVLYQTVTTDKTWVRDFELELKSQSNEWRSPTSLRPKKFRRAQSLVKQMMSFAYDHRGIIMTDRVPCGTSVTAAYYCDWMQKLCRKMHKNWPDLLEDRSLILHNNAHLRLGKVVTNLLSKYEWEVLSHAPYGPDMSPPDFDLFPKLKELMRGHRFSSLEEVSAAVTRAVRGLNKSGTLNGIANLPKRWNMVLEKQGDYIKGL